MNLNLIEPDGTPYVPVRKIKFTHGLGDCVQFATLVHYLRTQLHHQIEIECEQNKRAVFLAAGIPLCTNAEHAHAWKYHAGFNHPRATKCGPGNKVYGNLNVPPLRFAGEPDEQWEELCGIDCEHFGQRVVTPELTANAERFLCDLPRPIVLLHSRGTNFPSEKSIPDDVTSELYKRVPEATGGSLVLLDWDNRVPMPTGPRVKHLKRDWGGIETDQLLAIYGLADLLIGIDSGPFHLSNFTTLPALGIFHGFYPASVCLPRPSGRTRRMTSERFGVINEARRERWGIVEYRERGKPGKGYSIGPSAEEITAEVVRMLGEPKAAPKPAAPKTPPAPTGNGTWIPELKRELTGRSLAIWEGRSGLPPDKEDAYRRLWRDQAGEKLRGAEAEATTPDHHQDDAQVAFTRQLLGLPDQKKSTSAVKPVGAVKPRGCGCGRRK